MCCWWKKEEQRLTGSPCWCNGGGVPEGVLNEALHLAGVRARHDHRGRVGTVGGALAHIVALAHERPGWLIGRADTPTGSGATHEEEDRGDGQTNRHTGIQTGSGATHEEEDRGDGQIDRRTDAQKDEQTHRKTGAHTDADRQTQRERQVHYLFLDPMGDSVRD